MEFVHLKHSKGEGVWTLSKAEAFLPSFTWTFFLFVIAYSVHRYWVSGWGEGFICTVTKSDIMKQNVTLN